MKVQHRYLPQGKVLSEKIQSVSVDLVEPEVRILSPINGQVVLAQDPIAQDGKVLIQGLCSEHLRVVSLRAGNEEIVVTNCTAAGTFEVIAGLPGGEVEISASQMDAARNRGESTPIRFENGLGGPGAFIVAGVRSQGLSDTEIDGAPKDLPLVVHLGSSAGAIEYSVKIRNSNNQILCENSVRAPSSELVFDDQCVLQNQTKYFIEAIASNSYGNMTAASNSGSFYFITSFPKPTILSIHTDTLAGAHLDAGDIVQFQVEFSRSTVFSAGSRLKFSGISASAEAEEAHGVARMIHKYKLYVPNNINSVLLRVLSLQTDGLATWTDRSTPADLTISSDVSGNAYALLQKGIVLDSSPPPVGVFLSMAGMENMTSTPKVYFNKPSHRNSYEVRTRFKTLDGKVLVDWGLAEYNYSSATPFEEGLRYILEYKSQDIKGNESTAATREFTASYCPENFLWIDYGSESFCVAQFEAKRVAGKVMIIPQQVPMEVSSWQDANAVCQELGSGYSVISNKQWQILSNMVAADSRNWSTQVIGLGSLKIGHVASNKSEPVELSNPCSPRAADCETRMQRNMVLPNGKFIWDMAGNLPEHVRVAEAGQDPGNEGQVIALTTSPFFSPTVAGLENCRVDFMTGCHLGYVEGSSSFFNYLRGAGFSSVESRSGLFSVQRISTTAGGVRCTYDRP